MKWISEGKILIVGLGLMGGSYAMGLKRLGFYVSGIDTDKETVEYALSHGIIDEGYTDTEEKCVNEADAVIFALYPTAFKNWIEKYQMFLKAGAFITDVTGVKSCIVYDIQKMLRSDVEFVAAHPMAGREVSGIKGSDYKIFRDANYIVVPTDKNTKDGIDRCRSLGRILGFSNITVLSPEEHDKMIGFVSQLTHCIAVTLMTCSDSRHLADCTGDSFRDLTRIAKINDKMWSELFDLNKETLVNEMDKFINEFEELRGMIKSGDTAGVREKMRLSAERRGYFDKSRGN